MNTCEKLSVVCFDLFKKRVNNVPHVMSIKDQSTDKDNVNYSVCSHNSPTDQRLIEFESKW